MRYSTGRGVSPADIRRGIERTLVNGGNELPNAYLTGIVGARACVARPTRCDLTRGIVTASGSSAVTFHLTAPDPDFLYKLALPIADAVPATTPLFNAPLPLPATGPYRIHENLFSVFAAGLILLERNPHFHVWSTAAQPDGFPDRIIDWFGLTPTAELRAVERGAADIARVEADPSLPESVTTALRTHYASQLHYAPLVGLNLLWLSSLGCELARPGYGNGGICNRDIELQLERARRLENTDRRAAAQLRTRIDRQLTLAAPWNTIRFPRSAELLSRRTGNYTYCFLSAGACLDQLWVR
jgi:peptide/nickel transport system substrate-binding protein